MLYELTMFGTFYNQQIVNRFNYVSTGIPAAVSGSFALTAAFGAIADGGTYPPTAPFAKIMQFLSSAFSVNTIVTRAAADYDPLDFYERPFPTPYPGLAGGDAMSPALAYGYRTNRVRLDIDRGTKRFVGVPETAVLGGGVIGSAFYAELVQTAAAMSAILSYDDEGNTVTFAPCVVHKEEYTTPRGRKAYRYYPTLSEQLDNIATGITWQPYTTVRTQNSRQYGRGI